MSKRRKLLAASGMSAMLLGPLTGAAVAAPAVPAAQPTCGATLTSSIKLTADLDCSGYDGTALTIGAAKVSINLNGHTLTAYPGEVAISDTGYQGLKVTGGTVSGGSVGVYADDANYIRVASDAFVGQSGYAVEGDVIDDSSITASSATDSGSGFYLYSGAHNTVSGDSSGGGNASLVYLEYETDDTVSNNTSAGDTTYSFVDDYSTGDKYTGNTSTGGDSTEYGFYFYEDAYGTVTATDNQATGDSDYGFYIYEAYGYEANGHSTFTGNHSDGSEYGFYDYYSVRATYSGNEASGNSEYGYYLEYPEKYIVTGNTANDNYTGIYLTENYAVYNVKSFNDNTADDNTDYGLEADYGAPGSGNSAAGNGTNCSGVVCTQP